MIVRSASAGDIDAVVALWQRATDPTRLPSDRTAVERLLAFDADSLVVVEDDDDIVGTLIIGWDGWRCHLYRMAVDQAARRRGVGAVLLGEARRRAAARGIARLDALVHDGNDLGVAFWQGQGFVRDEADRRWTRDV